MKAKRRLERLTRTSGPEALVLLTVIGHRLVTKSGHAFSNPMLPHFLVHATGIGYVAPTPEQEARAVELWLSGAGDAYRFASSQLPTLEDGNEYQQRTPDPAPAGDTSEE